MLSIHRVLPPLALAISSTAFAQSPSVAVLLDELKPSAPGVTAGGPLAMDGVWAALGSASNTVTMFERVGSGWTERATVTGVGDFGRWSLDLDGDQLIVSSDSAAHVYVRTGASWSLEDTLTTGSDIERPRVAIAGDRAVLGVPTWDGFKGRAFVFARSGSSWILEEEVPSPALFAAWRFGLSVDLEGDRALIGAPEGSATDFPITGRAHLFERSGSSWNQVEGFEPSDSPHWTWFGASVALSGDRAIIGAPAGPDGAAIGAAYVFEKPTADWTEVAILHPRETEPGLAFGSSVAIDGAGALVGMPAGGTLTATGTSSVAFDDLAFAGADLLPGQPGLLFVGENAVGGGQGLAFGDGLRCAGGNVVRLGTQTPGGTGQVEFGPGLAPQGGWQPGDLCRFQLWYRDPVGSPCSSGFNTTQGVEVLFGP